MPHAPSTWLPRRLLWPLALMAVVSWASGKGQVELPFTLGLPSPDKFAHFGVFGLITVSVARAGGERARNFGWAFTGTMTSVLFGLCDETLQSFNPHRSGLDVGDWLADVSGAVTALVLWRNWDWGHRLLELRVPSRRRAAPAVSPAASPTPEPLAEPPAPPAP